jgi:SIR2-like domain/TIR domain
MDMMDAASGDQRQQADVAPPGLRVFISYRHEDTWGQAMLLHDRLANRFGAENVFLDAYDLQPGMKWLEEIKAYRASSNVLLALIGPQWLSIMKARRQAAVAEPAEDYVRFEIEYALRPASGVEVIPVLVGEVAPLTAEKLPRSLHALAKIQAALLRQQGFGEDVASLIAKLEAIARSGPVPEPGPPVQPVGPGPPVQPLGPDPAVRPPGPVPISEDGAPLPDDAHFDVILHQIVDRGNLVPVLGSGLSGRRRGPDEGSGSLPSASGLAAYLAERFGLKSARLDLPEVAQYVYVTIGRPDLDRELKKILTAECEPGPVHRFLARLPQTLETLGHEKRYQLIVSTNFDMALEQAFDDEGEPYDLAVYMADQGKFVHFPYEDDPVPIAVPNKYGEFPIGEDFELDRTVIVKIHGAVDGNVGDYRWKGNYVITQDHYIDYLSRSPVETLVPVQILDQLRESHCLFLGYPVRDWNLRVFLKRIWEDGRIEAQSWAIEPDPDALERGFWKRSSVDLYAADPADYVGQLHERLTGRALESAEP